MAKNNKTGIVITLSVMAVLAVVVYFVFIQKVQEVWYVNANGQTEKKLNRFQVWTNKWLPVDADIIYKANL